MQAVALVGRVAELGSRRLQPRTVKSFPQDLGEPRGAPVRVVTDYAPEEVAAFREQFKPLAEHYHQRSRLAGFGVAGFFLCVLLGMALPKPLFIYFWMAGVASWFFIVIAMPRTPSCPACSHRLDGGFGAFCPECGGRALQAGGWLRAPRCDACGKSMRRGRTRQYKIRACTHCGLRLDERGL